MDGFNQAMSIFILGAGIFIIYEYIKMVKTGHLSEILLLGKGVPESRCRDKEAFLKKALPSVLILGIATILYGIIDFINFFYYDIQLVDFVAMILFLFVLFGFMIHISKLKKQYIRPY